MPQDRFTLTRLEIGGVAVPMTSGLIARGRDPAQWDLRADGVPQWLFDSLIKAIGPEVDSTLLAFTDEQGVAHDVSCRVVRRSRADPGFNLSTGGLTFSFEGPIE